MAGEIRKKEEGEIKEGRRGDKEDAGQGKELGFKFGFGPKIVNGLEIELQK